MVQETLSKPTEFIPAGSPTFRVPLEISHLPYIFSGNIPSEPATMHWKLYLPNPDPDISPTLAADLLAQKPLTPYDGEIHISLIFSDSEKLRDENYRSASGRGSFLLDNFLSLADERRWRVSVVPLYTGSGKLKQAGLDKWYRKRGFVAHHNIMIREPQTPTSQTEITRILGY